MKKLLVGLLVLGSLSCLANELHHMHCTYDLDNNSKFVNTVEVMEIYDNDFSFNGDGYGYDDGYNYGYNDDYSYSDSEIDLAQVYYDGTSYIFPDGYETVNPFYSYEGASHFETTFNKITIMAQSYSKADLMNISTKMCHAYNRSLLDGSGILDHLTVDCSLENLKKVCF